jgi:lipoprotein-anchoring transpeptidase ErfK/SrfK
MNKWVTTLALTVATAAPLMAVPPAADPAPGETARLEVDLSERKLYVYHNDSLMNTFQVAVGTKENPTPTGTFTINRIIWNPGWVPPDEEWAKDEEKKAPGDPDNPMQGAKIFFKYPDYYIHGTNATGSLGSAASQGCLRMNEVDVENLAEFLQKVGGEDRGDEWFDGVRASETRTVQVTLSRPIRIQVRP